MSAAHSQSDLHSELCELGLLPEEILLHQNRIKESYKRDNDPSIEVKDTCRLDNGGILPEQYAPDDHHCQPDEYIAFIPAAGAASRYFKSFAGFLSALRQADEAELAKELEGISSQDLDQLCLPDDAGKWIRQGLAYVIEHREEIISAFERPKALQPCTLTGESFLHLKQKEHNKIHGVGGQVFVTPPGAKQLFEENLVSDNLATECLEQGPALSTVRFSRDGEFFRDEQGSLSLVPAGHGTLAKLFPMVKTQYPRAKSLFIRNIDNVVGTRQTELSATETFINSHSYLVDKIGSIRDALAKNNYQTAEDLAANFLASLTGPQPAEASADSSLWKLMEAVFHSSKATMQQYWPDDDEQSLIKRLYARPVNALGQVANSGKDVGGSPAVIASDYGVATLCVELPHVSAADREKFLTNPKKATHFNPVFVAAEFPEDADTYFDQKAAFWLLAKKSYRSFEVCYHETVLYELLGNSLLANVVFPQIPRSLFNPHKSVEDTKGGSL